MANTERTTGDVSPLARRRHREGPAYLPRHQLYECIENADRHRKRTDHVSNLCAWPDCEKMRPGGLYGEEVPLCTEHIYATWQLARDLAERRQVREKTVNVTDWKTKTARVVEQPTAQTGWIYYLRVDGHIKVGYASRLLNRLRQYPPTAEFMYAHRGSKAVEKATHSMLYLRRAAGREWYEDRAEVVDYVEKMRARYGPATDPRAPKPKDPNGYDYKPPPVRIVRG